jgi:hypothetical protein
MRSGVHKGVTLFPSTISQVNAEITKLEEAREQCDDAGIQRVIEGWIQELKKILAEGTKEDS